MSFATVGAIVLSFLHKFFSLIVACVMLLMTLLFTVGSGLIITKEGNFSRAGFAHFLAILIAIVTALCYTTLHFLPRKAYRFLYALTFLFLVSMLLVAHSLGLSAPVVSDCNTYHLIGYDSLRNVTWTDLGNIGMVLDQLSNKTTIIGKLGQPVRHCGENSLQFASAFINLVLYLIALFDVQKVLLTRVKSKTYGERFVEMGINT